MYISLAESCAKSFKRWSNSHPCYCNDNEENVARLDVLAFADMGKGRAVMTPFEGPRGPWLVPGMANTL